MNVLRAMLIWVLALSLPIEGMAANQMTHCKDMQKSVAGMSMQGMKHHNHAAMMAALPDATSMAGMHHAMKGHAAKKAGKVSQFGCKCGCKCSGNCAVSCSGMMMSLLPAGLVLDQPASALVPALSRGQAHAAYCYDPLRPPSALAI